MTSNFDGATHKIMSETATIPRPHETTLLEPGTHRLRAGLRRP